MRNYPHRFGLDIGYGFSDVWTVHLRLSEMSVPDPALSADGESVDARGDTTRAPTMLAPAVTYYVMPSNLYITGAFGLSIVRHPGYDGDTNLGDLGLGFNLDLGKEWWVDGQFGVGLAGRYWWLAVSGEGDAGATRTTEAHAAGLLLSITYQ